MTAPALPAAAALLVIDLQAGMFDGAAVPPIHDAEGLVTRVRQVIGWARQTGRPVAFIRHDGAAGEPLAPGAPGWPVLAALGQADDEPTFGKTVGNAFSNPALRDWLGHIRNVVLVGAQSDHCITASTTGALARGLGVTLVADAHSTWGDGTETADQIIHRCNTDLAAAGARLVESSTVSD
jgi:nicotinamidase-related amidase